jgi:hypothetical protein
VEAEAAEEGQTEFRSRSLKKTFSGMRPIRNLLRNESRVHFAFRLSKDKNESGLLINNLFVGGNSQCGSGGAKNDDVSIKAGLAFNEQFRWSWKWGRMAAAKRDCSMDNNYATRFVMTTITATMRRRVFHRSVASRNLPLKTDHHRNVYLSL